MLVSNSGGVIIYTKTMLMMWKTFILLSFLHCCGISANSVPSRPTSLSFSQVTPDSVRLSWNGNNKQRVNSYKIEYKIRDDVGAFIELENILRPSYMVDRLQAYTVYIFQVVAVNNAGQSDASKPVEVRTGELGLCFKNISEREGERVKFKLEN